jgi:hypothetical protein
VEQELLALPRHPRSSHVFSGVPVARLALDIVSTMHKHQISVPVFEVVQLSQLKLQES